MIPFRIHTQKSLDECTACAISAIAEDKLQVAIDPDYLYSNSKDSDFGIKPTTALQTAINRGLKVLNTGEIIYPFKDYRRIWGWFNLFGQIVKALDDGPVFCGCYWQGECDNSSFIKLPIEWLNLGGHAFKIYGTVEVNGILYLKIQNSRGTNIGDNGIWYAPKEVVNKFLFAYQLL